MRKDARDSGMACRFSKEPKTVFRALAAQVSQAAEESGKVDAVLVMAADEYGFADGERCMKNAPSELGHEGRFNWPSFITTTTKPCPMSSSTGVLDKTSHSTTRKDHLVA